jgi:transcriptional regulator with XRE-family HTH domain
VSQADLAAAVGLTRTSISNIEKGRQKMLVHTFLDIARALGIEPLELLPRLDTENAPNEFRFSGANTLPSERATIAAVIDTLPTSATKPSRKAR